MFGKIGDMGGMVKKALEMKKELEKIKAELAKVEAKGVFGSSVEVVVTGDLSVKSIRIAPESMKNVSPQQLEDMVVIATNNALDEAKKTAQAKMSVVTGGLNIPGLF